MKLRLVKLMPPTVIEWLDGARAKPLRPGARVHIPPGMPTIVHSPLLFVRADRAPARSTTPAGPFPLTRKLGAPAWVLVLFLVILGIGHPATPQKAESGPPERAVDRKGWTGLGQGWYTSPPGVGP